MGYKTAVAIFLVVQIMLNQVSADLYGTSATWGAEYVTNSGVPTITLDDQGDGPLNYGGLSVTQINVEINQGCISFNTLSMNSVTSTALPFTNGTVDPAIVCPFMARMKSSSQSQDGLFYYNYITFTSGSEVLF